MNQKNGSRVLMMLFVFAMTLVSFQFWRTEAQAQSSYFTSRGCVTCHGAPTVTTCAGCHYHSGTLSATTNKTTSYAPGETVTVTLTASGARSGWIGARLYNQAGVEVARSTGAQSGMGGATIYPAVLSAPAPAAAGTYSWRMAYLGNDLTGSGDVHSEKSVNVSVTVAAVPVADTTAPVVATFTLPASSTSLNVPVSALSATDNVAVTGYLVNKVASAPTASAAGWSATAPTSVTAVAGSNTFYAWAKDAAGNISLAKSASVTVTIETADVTAPTVVVSTLANGSYTNKATLNISGNVSDEGGLQSFTVNSQPVIVNADGSFSTAFPLVAGANTVTIVATDVAGNQQTDVRTINYDPTAPVLAVTAPGDNSISAQSFITLTGTISETSTVTVTGNDGSQQSAAVTGSNFIATANLVAGVNTITITATDLAGNTASAKRTVTYEGGTMTIAITRPSQDITTSRNSIVVEGKIVDAVGKISVSLQVNGRIYFPNVDENGLFKQALFFQKSGLYTILVTAKDAAGNSSTVTRNVIFRKYDDHDDYHGDERDDD
uniref:Uncharacterized protein n=1 Tax=Geobacter sp. (strain M21) TaxID=443144 RepID=C6E3N8_GEOSM